MSHNVTKSAIVVGRTTTAQTIAAINTDLVFNAIISQIRAVDPYIQYNLGTGVWTLGPGKLYRLRAQPAFGPFTTPAAGVIDFAWVTSPGNTRISAEGGLGRVLSIDQTTAPGIAPAPEAFLLFRNTSVSAVAIKLRVLALGGGPVDLATSPLNGGFASVEMVD